MTHLTEEEVAELIAALAPAPTAWVEAAIELPRARATIDELVAGAVGDRERRAAMLADLEAALRAAGVTPRPQLVDELRARLGASTR
ncbi:MAG: hypothetical protein JO321_06950 [Solirubrobacterales bacterium]|nr:hypothetical protein [Solirubrobacterales bacterium]MBV9166794.1 hypothetical protein [Solirubrobacterales bacterium]MBV9535136.1 hypothetical protein [Solirubrobacterales bacterium]